MRKLTLLALVGLAALAWSCQPEQVPDSLSLNSETTATVPSEGDVVSISFNSNVAWTAESDAAWLTLSPTSGEAGDATVKASAVKNDTNDSRTANVTIKAGTRTATVTVTQAQLDGLEVPTRSIEVGVEGGNITIPVSSNIDYTVEIPEAAENWIELIQTKAMESHEVILKIAPSYDTEARSANVTINGGSIKEVVAISQAAFEPYYDLILPEGVGQFSGFGDGNPLVLPQDCTTYTIEVQTNLEHYCYFAPWDSELGQAVETNDVGWIKFEYDANKIVFTLEPNDTYLAREEYFYSGCYVGDVDFGAYGSCVLIRQEGKVPEAGASVIWTKTLSEVGVPAAYNRLAYKTAGGDALLVSDGEKVHALSPADGTHWKAITWSNIKPTSICSDDAGNIIAAENNEFSSGTSYSVYYTTDVNKDPVELFSHTADFWGTIGGWRVRGDLSQRAVVTGFVAGSRYWAGWEIDNFGVSLDNYYNVNGQTRGPIAHDADAWNPESGAVMSLGPRLNEGIVYRAYDTNWCLNYLKDAYTPAWLVPYDWKEISTAGAGQGNENQCNMDIIDYNGRRIIAYTQGVWFSWGGNRDVYFLDITNPENCEVLAVLSGDLMAAEETIDANYPYADVKLHVEDEVGLVCYVVNSAYGSLSKLLLNF